MLNLPTKRPGILDATRLADGKTVFLKRVPKDSPEIEIGRYLSSEELQKHQDNHACPLLDVLHDDKDDENVILVFPTLRRLDMPELASVRECVDLIYQTLEVR